MPQPDHVVEQRSDVSAVGPERMRRPIAFLRQVPDECVEDMLQRCRQLARLTAHMITVAAVARTVKNRHPLGAVSFAA